MLEHVRGEGVEHEGGTAEQSRTLDSRIASCEQMSARGTVSLTYSRMQQYFISTVAAFTVAFLFICGICIFAHVKLVNIRRKDR
jgi:hypothetical protein